MLLVTTWACVTPPPANPEDACRIFGERLDWYRAARASEDRWGLAASVQLAVIHQESSFRAQARPPRARFLWIFPGARPSSAYGYGQVTDSTWERYRRQNGRAGADRDDFSDVTDFIGWYGQEIRRTAGLAPSDTRSLYLAYHEGPAGFLRGTHESKAWLGRVAARVAQRAERYEQQLRTCRPELEARIRGPWWWPF